jgi:DNA-binding NarL/FixJ family response regulator
MLRVAIFDHHPAVRRGLQVGIDALAALKVVGTAADRTDLWPLLESSPGVDVLVIGKPPRDHATEICRLVRARHPSCRVVLYSAPWIAVPAVLAGAHALVDRSEDLDSLVEAIWDVAGGLRVLPPLTPELQREAAKRLTPADQAIVAMLLAGTSPADVAAVVGLSRRELEGRRAAILATLAGRRVALEAEPPLAA